MSEFPVIQTQNLARNSIINCTFDPSVSHLLFKMSPEEELHFNHWLTSAMTDDDTMSKRPYVLVDGYENAPPAKMRKTLTPHLPVKFARQPAAPIVQIPTPERSRGTATASTTASKPDPYYEVPQKYSLVSTVRTLGSGGQARAVLCQGRGGNQFVVKFFKKSKYAIREAKIIRQIHGSAGAAADRYVDPVEIWACFVHALSMLNCVATGWIQLEVAEFLEFP